MFACATIYSIIYENYLLALMFGGFVIIDIGLIWDKHKKDKLMGVCDSPTPPLFFKHTLTLFAQSNM